jgi:hypothetical protein
MSFVVEHVRRRTPAKAPGKPAVAAAQPMTNAEIVSAIGTIKERARRLRPPLNDKPHQWHEDKSELVRDVEVLEDAVRKGEPLPSRLKERA